MKGPFSFWTFFGVTIWIDMMTAFFFLFVKKKKNVTSKKESLSVMIPVHKESLESLRLTIKSLYEEKYPIKKLIICSDGDSKNLSGVVNEFSLKHNNIEYLESPDRSKAKKMNFVVKKYGASLGKYLYVRDCKVVSGNNCMERMTNHFYEPSIAAVTSYGHLIKPKGFLSRSYYYGKNWVNEIGRFRKRAQDSRQSVFVICGASTMYRVDVLQKIPVPHTTKTEDTHYTWLLQFKGYKVKVADDAIVYAQDIDGKRLQGITSQLKQSYRWSVGTIQCFFVERKSFNKSKKLSYSTIVPGFLEAFTYSIALVLLPVFFFTHIFFAIGFLIGDMVFSLIGTLIFIPKRFFHTLWHYPQIAFFKYLNSLVFMTAFIVVIFQSITNKKSSWSNEWIPEG